MSESITWDQGLSLEPELKSAIETIPVSSHYLIALSGGLDSVALLHFCLPYLRQFTANISVVHVHHGLSEHADEWASFCEGVCHHYDLALTVERVKVISQGEGVESAARKLRYRAFTKYLAQGSVLLQGHHLNDQAETLLMRFIKGLGPAALQGIPQKRALSDAVLYRPWLHLPRRMLETAMRTHGFTWVEDESNDDRRFERNFIRHEVLPILESRRATVLHDLNNSARRSGEYVEFVRAWCQAHEARFLSQHYVKTKALDIAQLKTFSELQQSFILRYWLDLLGLEHPSEANFSRILTDLVQPERAPEALVVWNETCLRAFNGALCCLGGSQLDSPPFMHRLALAELENAESCYLLTLPQGQLTIVYSQDEPLPEDPDQEDSGYAVSLAIPKPTDAIIIRSRQPADKIYLNADMGKRLKKLYQSHRIVPWHRDQLPIIETSVMHRSGTEERTLIASLAGFVSHDANLKRIQTDQVSAYIRFSYKPD